MLEKLSIYKLAMIIISLHGFFLAALMAAGQLAVNRKSVKNLLYLDLFILFGIIQAHLVFHEAGLLARHIAIQNLNIPAVFAVGPVMYFFASFALDRDYQVRAAHFLHYLPSLGMYAAALLISFRGQSAGANGFLDGLFYNIHTFSLWSFGNVSFFLYLAAIARLLLKSFVFGRGSVRVLPHARVLVVVYAMVVSAWICMFVSILTRATVFIEAATICITAVIVFLFLVNFRHPDFYQVLHRAVSAERTRRTYLTGIDQEAITHRLEQLMDDDAFADENISLPSLAKTLDISTHQLSELINDRFGASFTAYINTKRIDRAKELLLLDTDSPVLSIAYEVGFRSKSAFNEAFKKVTGISPSRFRRNNQSTRHV